MAKNSIKMPVVTMIQWDASCCYLMRIIHWLFFTRRWIFDEAWYFELFTGNVVKIPKGFVADGASIPKLFRFALSPTGILFLPGILHDFGYKYNKLIGVQLNCGRRGEEILYDYHLNAGKRYWDYVFRQTGYQVCKLYIIPFVAWLALVCFGHFAWRKHRRQ